MSDVKVRLKRYEKILVDRLEKANSPYTRSAYIVLLTHFRSMFSEELQLSDPKGSDHD